jgi:hypothetical protein
MGDIANLGIKVTTTGVKEASRDLDGLTKDGKEAERQASRVAESWKKAGTTIGIGVAAGIGVAGLALKKYFQNTIESEKVQAQLAARIKSTGQAARLTVADLNKMAAALQFKTSFDDEAIGGAQAMLLTFTKIGNETFPRATEAVLDMSTALGTDLNSAALQVGKALNDPVQGITALSRAGVQFSESQKKIIKDLVDTGKQADAQRIILGELEKQMGGAAAAARNTLGGALQALGNSFNNLLEGDSGDKGIQGTRLAIESLNDTLNDPDVKRGVDNVVSGIARIVAECVEGIGALQRFGQNVDTVFSISKKVSSGAPVSDFTDRELQVRTANLSTQKSNARAKGDTAEVARLQGLITAAIREGTRRNIATLFEGVTAEVGGGRELANKGGSGGGGGGGGGGRSRSNGAAAAAALRERILDTDKLTAAQMRAEDSQLSWSETVADMAAELQGPLAQAQREYQKNLDEITRLEASRQITTADATKAREIYAQQLERTTAAINEQLTPAQELIGNLQQEISLLGKYGIAKEIAIAQQYAGKDATQAELASIADLVAARKAANDAAYQVDEFNRDGKDALFDFASGAKTAKDAALDFLDSVADRLLRMATDNLWDKAFGGASQAGSNGSGGGWLSAIMGLFSSSGSGGWGDMSASDFGAAGFRDGGAAGRPAISRPVFA